VWGYSLKQELGDLKKLSDPKEAKAVEAAQAKAKALCRRSLQAHSVLDSGARGSTNTFVQREIGDVLVGWENEAFWPLTNSAKTS